MIGKSQSHVKPTALGAQLQAAVYGQAVPSIYGLTKAAFLPIWMQNVRQGGSGKKFKNKKKGITTYVSNVDFLFGSNPITGMMQAWVNTSKIPLNFVKVSQAASEYNLFNSYTIADAKFYAVVAVTYTVNYSLAVNDYGGPGSSTLTGSFEVPCWNLAHNGPDPTTPSTYTQYPWVYYWVPANGNVVSLPTAFTGLPGGVSGVSALNVYYAQLSSTINESPAAYLRLTFEPILADGPEYTGNIIGTSTPLSTQQVLMPPYAGAGSSHFDLGASGVLPDVRPEVQGSFGVYPTGDADFADMIEDIVKSGLQQTGIGDTANNLGFVQHGASAYDLPGAVQRIYETSLFAANMGSKTFKLANIKGNFLLAYHFNVTNTTGTFSDTGGNTWNVISSGTDPTGSGYAWNLSWAQVAANTGPGNTVSFSGAFGNGNNGFFLAEIVGVDTFDNSSVTTFATQANPYTSTLTTGGTQGNPTFCISFMLAPLATGHPIQDPTWNDLFGGSGLSNVGNLPALTGFSYNGIAGYKTVYAPGTVRSATSEGGSHNYAVVIMASFKLANPSIYPKAFGNFIDKTSMDVCRTQARAYGLYGSLAMQSQKACREWLKDLYSSMNSAPFYSGNLLKQAPYGEVSTAGNGALYTAPAAAGPIANLTDLNGDFIATSGEQPVTIERTAQFDQPNVLQYQITNRASDYNPVVVSQPEAGSVAIYGVRKAAPEVHDEITDTSVARILLGIKCRRQNYIRDTVKFKLGPKGILYEPMDLVTITESLSALSSYPVRFTSIDIGADWTADCETEQYVYGVHGPSPVVAASLAPFVPNTTSDPGNINTPIIFEPVPRLSSSQSQAQLWAVASSSNVNYGGCYVYLSTDGGSSYNQVGTIASNGITGVTTADWPIASDPDTTNNLPLDLTESLGVLASYAAADRDNFTYPCYIAGGNASIPYGLMTYNSATLTATNKYTLNATGAGNELRRCVFGAPVAQPGPDVDHPNGSRWAFLGNPAQPNPPGILKLTMDPKWIGVTLMFKFLPFNTFGNTVESLSAVTAYSFTPTGLPGGGVAQNQSYTNTPSLALSQTSTTNLALVQVSTKFSTNTVNYNARSTITVPTVTSPTWFYVYIVDPSYTGDIGATTSLATQVDTTQAHLGVPGYTYMGAIQALPSGFAGAIVLPGGYPPPSVNIIGS